MAEIKTPEPDPILQPTLTTIPELAGCISGQARDLSIQVSGDGTVSYLGRGFQHLREVTAHASELDDPDGGPFDGAQCTWRIVNAISIRVPASTVGGQPRLQHGTPFSPPYCQVVFSQSANGCSGRFKFVVEEAAFVEIGRLIELLLPSDALRYKIVLGIGLPGVRYPEYFRPDRPDDAGAFHPLRSFSVSAGVLL